MTASPAAAAPLPAKPLHQQKPSVDELFEHRWRTAYEVRALERESRQAKSQAGSRSGSIDAGGQATPATDAAAAEALDRLALGGSGPGAQQQPSEGQPAQRLRQQEVEDDEDFAPAAPLASPAAASAPLPGGAPQPAPQQQQQQQRQQEGLAAEGEDEGEEDSSAPQPALKWVWDSSSRRRGAAASADPPPAAGTAAGVASSPAAALKERGNALLKAGDCVAAVQAYTEGLAALDAAAQQWPQPEAEGDQSSDAAAEAEAALLHLRATLLSNRAHALLKLKRHDEAASDARLAHVLRPAWPKPLYRLAQAQLAAGRWAAAVAACRAGEALSPLDSDGHSEFTPLLDTVAVHAARAGSLAGYDGAQLEVRSAGDEAWLGRPAPHVPELDGPEDEDAVGPATTLPALPGTDGEGLGAAALSSAGGGPSGDALVGWDYRQTAAVRARRRTSFRSIKEAVAAARDGDRILLRAGVHNGMGECVTLGKRVLVEGEGALGDAVIDQRANCPTFRICRGGVVLRNLDLDQTGFREALLVEGPATAHPLVQGCRIRCSGDDAVNTAGSAAPTFLRCTISAKKCGLKAYASSAPRLEACVLEQCGEQGLRAQESAAPTLHGCTIAECGEEGVVAMDSAHATLASCRVRDCKGPGVDVSGAARATISGGRIEACVGGVWAWDGARVALAAGACVAGGPSHALLADGAAALEVRDSTVEGSVHATEAAWAGILHASNTLAQPEGATDFPAEAGPFRWTPNPYSRK